MDFKKNQVGLSLIELLILVLVVSVIVILGVNIYNPLNNLYKMRDGTRKQDLKQLQSVLDLYYRDRHEYPKSQNYKIVDFKTNFPINWGEAWIPYMNFLPKDPDGSRSYVYYATNNNQTYYLFASLETDKD